MSESGARARREQCGLRSRQYSAHFRQRFIGLVEEGRDVEELAGELGISSAKIYRWRTQSKVDADDIEIVNTGIAATLADARQRTPEWEEELPATEFAASMLGDEAILPKDGCRSLRR